MIFREKITKPSVLYIKFRIVRYRIIITLSFYFFIRIAVTVVPMSLLLFVIFQNRASN